jgi:hypothetical protein
LLLNIRKKEEGRRKKEEGRRKKEEGRRKKEESPSTSLRVLITKKALQLLL